MAWIAQIKEARRRKKQRTGDSPEKLAERHAPKRDWIERALRAEPGGQRHSDFKGDRR